MFQTVRVQKIKTHSLCWIKVFFRKSCRLRDHIKIMVAPAVLQMTNTVRRMRIACCITKATDTHSKYIILAALSRQQWLCERASILRLFLVHCLCCCAPLNFLHRNLTGISQNHSKNVFCSLCNDDVRISVLIASVGWITVELWMGKDLERSGEAQGGPCGRLPGSTEGCGAHLSQNTCRLCWVRTWHFSHSSP